LRFAEEGAQVILIARGRSQLDEVAAEIEELGTHAVVLAADVTSDKDALRLTEAARDLGGLDILVNNAGTFIQNRFMDYSMEQWNASWDLNVMGVVRMTRAVLPLMVDAGYGRIINIASTAAKWGTAYQAAYNAAKHAVLGLTRSLALEVAANGIRVTAICPANVDTDLVDRAEFARVLGIDESEVDRFIVGRIPIGRLIKPEEIAGLAVYLASAEADAITGVGLTAAGGLSLI
jgi:NAD(P)-dependent dehydrogenase (short-subunit alcohol dehydrogenase family)